ncbi:hypothetical protein SNE40_004294 [Patella caerulea]|uniref:CCHC-type domain-containing protein n=1 Tax=Patella caerulea TaxID=87958 RepID=A0AAN8K2M1_PATCE
MADYIVDVELEDDDIDQSVLRRVVKVTVHRNEYVYRMDILSVVSNLIGNNTGIVAMAKRDNNEEWFITLTSERLVKILIDKGACVFNGKHYYFCDADTSVVNLRIHWVPRYLRDSFLLRVFRKYGVVKSIREELMVVDDKRLHNGLRLVTLNCTSVQVQRIPHMIRTAQGTIRMLVTAPGRLPLCLRCNCIGHRSMNCEKGDNRVDVVRAPRFSDVVGGRSNREQQDNDIESNKGSDESMRQSEDEMVSNDEREEVSSEEGTLEIDLDKEVEEGKEEEMNKTGEIPSSGRDLFKETQEKGISTSKTGEVRSGVIPSSGQDMFKGTQEKGISTSKTGEVRSGVIPSSGRDMFKGTQEKGGNSANKTGEVRSGITPSVFKDAQALRKLGGVESNNVWSTLNEKPVATQAIGAAIGAANKKDKKSKHSRKSKDGI